MKRMAVLLGLALVFGVLGNAEAQHQRRNRDAHDRLVQDHDERRDDQQVDHAAVAACDGGCLAVESRGVHGRGAPQYGEGLVVGRVRILRLASGGRQLAEMVDGAPLIFVAAAGSVQQRHSSARRWR